MKLKTIALLAAILSIVAGTTGAEARRAGKSHQYAHRYASAERSYHAPRAHRTAQRTTYRQASTGSFFGGFRSASAGSHSAGPRPAKWCGWYMRTQLGGGAEYNIARNWKNYGRATSPQVGAVVVWPQHVGMITGRSSNGKWIVKSGNYSGGVREVPMSVSGASFRI